MTYYVGVDIGTSSVKLSLVDASGSVCANREVAYSVTSVKPGWLEIDPAVWFVSAMIGLSSLLEGIKRSNVCGIGFTGQMHTAVFLNKDGESIRPAISWNDTRTADLVRELKDETQEYDELRHIRQILSTGCPAANLRWLKMNEPDDFNKIHKILIGPGFLTYRFTGVYSTDYCEASTSSLFNIYSKEWSPLMCRIIGISESVLPKVRGAGEIVGKVLPAIADELGLSRDVRVITGTGDNPATYLSSGQISSGEPMISLGTSGILMFSRDGEIGKAKGKPYLFSVDGNYFDIIVQGAVQSTGSSFRWWAKDILQGDHYDSISGLVDCTKPVDKRLLFYPHLAGDKTIYADPHLRGAFIGISTDSTREETTRVIMEGIGFAFRQLMEEMRVDKKLHAIKVTGGMSCIPAFMQIFADILNVHIEISTSTGAAQGIALLAAQSCGIEDIFNKNASSTDHMYTYQQREEFVGMYNEKYSMYIRIYDSIKKIYISK